MLVIPAIALYFANGLWVALTLGLLCARFRDLAQVVAVGLNIAFFVTPIFWTTDQLGWRQYIADWNPLHHFVDILRAPLIAAPSDPHSWLAVLVVTTAGWLFTLGFAARLHRRIVFWV